MPHEKKKVHFIITSAIFGRCKCKRKTWVIVVSITIFWIIIIIVVATSVILSASQSPISSSPIPYTITNHNLTKLFPAFDTNGDDNHASNKISITTQVINHSNFHKIDININPSQLSQETMISMLDDAISNNTELSTVQSRQKFNYPITNPNSKLLYCFIAKNSCTKVKWFMLVLNAYFQDLKKESKLVSFSQLSQLTNINKNSNLQSIKDLNLSMIYYNNITKYHIDMELHDFVNAKKILSHKIRNFEHYDEIMMNPDWNKLVILRDPLERLLSGYVDKCVKHKRHLCEVYKDLPFRITSRNKHMFENVIIPNFTQFAEKVIYKIENNIEINIHYRPQVFWCDLYKYINYYNIIIYYNRETFAQEFKNVIIERLNLSLDMFYNHWGEFQNETLLGSQTIHVTNSSHVMKQYYTPELARKVYKAFIMDYTLLNIPYPTWIQEEW